MIKYFLSRQLDKFERNNSYDATYARDLLEASPVLTFLMFLIGAVARRPREVSVEAWYAAAAAAALEADCGPCVQLGVTLATREGVPVATLRALLADDLEAVSEETRVAFLYARHSLRRTPEAEALREQVLRRYGRRVLSRLAHHVTLVHSYPVLKSLLGHARSCTRVYFPGDREPVRPAATARPISV
jgi:hypothetical protein